MARQPRRSIDEPVEQTPNINVDAAAIQADALNEAARQMREPVREVVREPVREPTRPLKPGEFLGRNGEILTLKRDPSKNIFDIPAHLNDDPTWTREWKRFEIYNKYDETHQQHLQENGWRPVMVEPGNGWGEFYGGPNYRGPVRREDMVLMERPAALTAEVRRREKAAADAQMRSNTDRFAARRALDTPQGFTTSNPNVPSKVQSTYEQGPTPAKHQIAIE